MGVCRREEDMVAKSLLEVEGGGGMARAVEVDEGEPGVEVFVEVGAADVLVDAFCSSEAVSGSTSTAIPSSPPETSSIAALALS